MKKVVIRPVFLHTLSKLNNANINAEQWREYFPRHLLEPISFDCGLFKNAGINLMQLMLRLSVEVFLQPRKGAVEGLDIAEVEKVYNREAATYDSKHHLTTHGMDTSWRRLAGYSVVNFGRGTGKRVSALDICTGTGLTISEMTAIVSSWGIKCSFTGLDYNEKMLERARARKIRGDGIEIDFVRGDAMDLIGTKKYVCDKIQQFDPESFDVAIQMFGIGGISDPLKVFNGVLQILKPGGQYFLTDMHQPVFKQPGEWPFLLKWFNFPALEAVTYNKTTLPLVLNRLWGWRDTTLDFYLLPLVTYADSANKKWGFRVMSFEAESQRWWLGLPIMPIGKIIVEKVCISDADFEKRQRIFSVVS